MGERDESIVFTVQRGNLPVAHYTAQTWPPLRSAWQWEECQSDNRLGVGA